MDHVIVTRHPALSTVLLEDGIAPAETPVIQHVTDADKQINGKHVYGVIPFYFAAKAAKVTVINLVVPLHLRGKELTKAEVRQYMSDIKTYKVEEVPIED